MRSEDEALIVSTFIIDTVMLLFGFFFLVPITAWEHNAGGLFGGIVLVLLDGINLLSLSVADEPASTCCL